MAVPKTIAAYVLCASTAVWAEERRAIITPGARTPAAISAAAFVNDTDRGIERFRTRVRQDPRDFISYNILGSLLVRKGRETGALERYEEAEAAFRHALERNREYTPARVNLAAVCVSQHRFGEGLEIAKQVRAQNPNDLDVLATLGDALLELGRYAEAEDAYGELRRKAPGNPAVLARDARLAEIHGKNDQAVSLLKQAADAVSRMAGDRGEVAWYRTRIGEILFRTGRLDQAEEQYRAALDARPDDYGASEHMAELRAAEEKYDEAVALYEAAATRWPRPEMFQALGDLYAFRRRPDQAKPWHDRAIAIYLRDAQRGRGHYYHHLAAFYSDSREDAAEAVRWAEKDLEVRQSIYAYDALGWALYRAGRFPEAAAAAKRALAAGTEDAHFLYHAGMIESRAGNAQRGAELLRQALAVNPRHQSFHVHR